MGEYHSQSKWQLQQHLLLISFSQVDIHATASTSKQSTQKDVVTSQPMQKSYNNEDWQSLTFVPEAHIDKL